MNSIKPNEVGISSYRFKNEDLNTRPDILRSKRVFGMSYGVIVGLSFAIATWAADGFILSQSHVFLPWAKLIIGIMLCSFIAGLAGWITARFEHWHFALTAWLGVAVFFAWLLIALPLQISPFVSAWFKPQWNGLIVYETFNQLSPRFWVAFMWILIFVLISGVLQIPLVEPAAISVRVFGRIAPFLLGMFIMGLSGFVSDSLNNQPLRAGVVSLDQTIQFVLDNKNVDIEPALSRAYHAGALRGIKDQVTTERLISIGKYNSTLGEIDVIVQFQGLIASCKVIYEQPSFCKPAIQE